MWAKGLITREGKAQPPRCGRGVQASQTRANRGPESVLLGERRASDWQREGETERETHTGDRDEAPHDGPRVRQDQGSAEHRTVQGWALTPGWRQRLRVVQSDWPALGSAVNQAGPCGQSRGCTFPSLPLLVSRKCLPSKAQIPKSKFNQRSEKMQKQRTTVKKTKQ